MTKAQRERRAFDKRMKRLTDEANHEPHVLWARRTFGSRHSRPRNGNVDGVMQGWR
jgi:hypothetical protein